MSAEQEICKAVRANDLAKVKILLATNKTLNLNKTAEWFEPWFQTIYSFFTKSKLPVPSMYLGPMTPLAIAATYGYYNILKTLIESKRVDVNAKSGRLKDHTPLDCAIRWGEGSAQEKIIEYLVKSGAKRDITLRDISLLETLGEKCLTLLGEIPKIVTSKLIPKL